MIVREAETIIKTKMKEERHRTSGRIIISKERGKAQSNSSWPKTSGFVAFAKVLREAKMSRHGSVFANKGKIA